MATSLHCVYPPKVAGTAESTRPSIICKAKPNELAFKETQQGIVDYDNGHHEVSGKVTGIRKDGIPARYRIRVAGNRFQKDWTVSEVVDLVLSLNLRDDIDGVLNHWVGRFARKNFPYLIKVSSFINSNCRFFN